jgi:hypothetical protein|nr:MAG TPA: hypothetical protein [Caudoviricetes sp.]DAY78893.1 MAG TPA: hypothetical protein [Caudoviricetes sp.]
MERKLFHNHVMPCKEQAREVEKKGCRIDLCRPRRDGDASLYRRLRRGVSVMNLIEDYQGRLDDLLTDASMDDIDPIDLLVNSIADYLEGELEDEEDKTLCVDFGGKSLIISIVSNDEQSVTERVH